MALILTVLEIVTPVFVLAAIGFTWVKLGFEYKIEFVTRLAMTLSLPCLIFSALVTTEIPPSDLSIVTLAAIAAHVVIALIFWALVKVTRLDVQTYLAPLIFGNTGNLGLPLALFAFGDEGLGYAVVIFAVSIVFSFTFGIWLVSGGGSLRKVVQEPLVGATLLGAVFMWFDWSTPDIITNTLTLIGQMAIPLMLVTLGVAVASLRPQNISRSVILSVLKAALCVAVGWSVGFYFDLSPVPLAVLVVQISTPVAVTSYLLAQKYEADSSTVAGLVVVSTLLAVGYIPLTLAFLI